MSLLLLVLGVTAAGAGGELFVRGAVGLAGWARVPPGIIGATVAAFATSSPELSVGVQSAAAGTPEIALGDALGSNVINVACVLGLVLVTLRLPIERSDVQRELAFAALAPVLTLLALVDGRLVRGEALVLLAVFGAWLALVTRAARRARMDAVEDLGGEPPGPALLGTVVGLALLVLAGRLIVLAAKGIGADLGLGPFVVGATLVAIGTSTPELATALISRWRGHFDVGVGTVLGSNVFNNLWIVGVAAFVHPIHTDVREVLLAIGACLVALALVVPPRGRPLGRSRGVVLLLLAVGYLGGTVALGL